MSVRLRHHAALQRTGGVDGTRWADPTAQHPGAEARAIEVVSHLTPNERVLDLGAGSQYLAQHVAPGRYQAADVVAHRAGTVLCDLSRGLPDGSFKRFAHSESGARTVVLSDVLAYLNAPGEVLTALRPLGDRLIASYPLTDSSHTGVRLRAENGWRTHWNAEAFQEVLRSTGWTVETYAERQRPGGFVEAWCVGSHK